MSPPLIEDLARRIYDRRPEGPERYQRGPYILFLGEGCAVAAGVPTREALADKALRTFGEDPSSLNPDGVLKRFYEHLARLTPQATARMLQRLYASLPVPAFYRDLAVAVRHRLFPLIMTTNIDTLLEQALRESGMGPRDFRVTSIGLTQSYDFSEDENVVNIIKLHGDLGQGDASVVPQNIDMAVDMSKRFIKAELRGDLIMVGHRLGDDPVDRWLGHAPDRQLWWVNDEAPIPLQRGMLNAWSSYLREIHGELARPPIFFSELSDSLLRLVRGEDVEVADAESFALETIVNEAAERAVDEGRRLIDLLSGEIRRSQSALQSLEQEAIPVERSPKVQEQIKYEKNHITQLEDKMRSLPDVKPRVVDLIDHIFECVRKAGTNKELGEVADPAFQDYVALQVQAAKNELLKESPNPFLVSASIGATLTLADRLLTKYGPSVISADDVRELAAYAPTAAGKVLL